MLAGVTADGKFRTAGAKEYPPDLNHALAAAFCDAVVKMPRVRDAIHAPEQAKDVLRLQQGELQRFYSVVQAMYVTSYTDSFAPDYARRERG